MHRIIFVFIVLVALLLGGTMAARNAIRSRSFKRKLETFYPIISCDSLLEVDISDLGGEGSSITQAQETVQGGIKVCLVTGTLAPAITVQISLPLETWAQRYLQIGCGRLCGSISFELHAASGCQVLANGGFVLATTNMGHSENEPDWAEDPQKRVDFAYRAHHVTRLTAHKLITTFYGQSEKFSYFNGCSDGGREGLIEAGRYPTDFNGIIAGAPILLFQVQNTLYNGWLLRLNTDENNNTILLPDKLPMLHQAVLDECDILDGVKDNLISNPAACKFDPQSIQCSENATNTTQCLTAAEMEVVRKVYTGPQDPSTGAYLTPGPPLYGSELEWSGLFVGEDAIIRQLVLSATRYMSFTRPRPNFTINDLQFTEQTLDALRPRHPFLDTSNTNLEDFANAGGKLILWSGLIDPAVSPSYVVSFYYALLRDMGEEQVHNFARLYLLPGKSHCEYGVMDLLDPIITWVEEGDAPNAVIMASQNQDGSSMTRPLYPYPFASQYIGNGDIYDAANWKQGPAVEYVPTRAWAGADLIGRYEYISMDQDY